MLVIPKRLLGSIFQEYLNHNFLRQLDWLVHNTPGLHHPTWMDVVFTFFFSHREKPFLIAVKGDWEQPHTDISQLWQGPKVHPIRSCRLCSSGLSMPSLWALPHSYRLCHTPCHNLPYILNLCISTTGERRQEQEHFPRNIMNVTTSFNYWSLEHFYFNQAISAKSLSICLWL